MRVHTSLTTTIYIEIHACNIILYQRECQPLNIESQGDSPQQNGGGVFSYYDLRRVREFTHTKSIKREYHCARIS